MHNDIFQRDSRNEDKNNLLSYSVEVKWVFAYHSNSSIDTFLVCIQVCFSTGSNKDIWEKIVCKKDTFRPLRDSNQILFAVKSDSLKL